MNFENLIELLLPAIVFLLFVLGKLFGGDKDEEESPPPASQPRRDQTARETEADERTRQIQEEIRRKIAERRGDQPPAREPPAEQQTPAPPPPVQAQPAPRQQEPAHGLGRYEKQGQNRWDEYQQQDRWEQYGEPASEPTARSLEDIPDPTGGFQARIEEQRRLARQARERLEKARREREQKEQQARNERNAARWGPQAGISAGDLNEEVRLLLGDPLSARKAFLLQEIVGTPVGMRGPMGEQRPKWAE